MYKIGWVVSSVKMGGLDHGGWGMHVAAGDRCLLIFVYTCMLVLSLDVGVYCFLLCGFCCLWMWVAIVGFIVL